MAFVPNRFRPSSPATGTFSSIDRLFGSDADTPAEPVKGSPFTNGCAAYIAYCQPWAPPFDLEELEFFDD